MKYNTISNYKFQTDKWYYEEKFKVLFSRRKLAGAPQIAHLRLCTEGAPNYGEKNRRKSKIRATAKLFDNLSLEIYSYTCSSDKCKGRQVRRCFGGAPLELVQRHRREVSIYWRNGAWRKYQNSAARTSSLIHLC